LTDWDKLRHSNWLHSLLSSNILALYWGKIFDMVSEGQVDSWAYRWTYSSFRNNKLTIIPDRNLVSNLGYGAQATHTTRKSLHGNFQMSNQEALAYQKDPRHIVPSPYGSGAVRHSADQSFQTRIADIPDHQHYLKTKCRAGGLVEEYEAYYDKSRWIYTDLPERLPPL